MSGLITFFGITLIFGGYLLLGFALYYNQRSIKLTYEHDKYNAKICKDKKWDFFWGCIGMWLFGVLFLVLSMVLKS